MSFSFWMNFPFGVFFLMILFLWGISMEDLRCLEPGPLKGVLFGGVLQN